MRVESAIDVIGDLAFLPGWKFEATDGRHRHQDTLILTVYAPNPDTGPENLNGHRYSGKVPGGARAAFYLPVGDIADDDLGELHFRILGILTEVFQHEGREALRDAHGKVSHFNPHRLSGRHAWADRTGRPPELDLLYGMAG